jgi:small GTP-binding protein
VRLADVICHWLGKVEVVLAGADDDLREGDDALAAGDAMRARAAAHRVLARAPDSPLGLALLADACEAGQLDAELAQTLEELARRAPSRAEVWVRLARARRTTGAGAGEARDALVRGLAVAEPGSEARREALLGLADLDLAEGDGTRAQLWLERAAPDDRSPEIAVRRAEALLLLGDPAGAIKRLEPVTPTPTDPRDALVRGRGLAMLGDSAAFAPLLRAMVLDAPGASEALSSALAYLPSDGQTRTRVRSVVDAKGEQALARWRAAFARAEGARDAARQALREAVAAGDAAAVRPLLDAAIEDRDARALEAALQALPDDDSASAPSSQGGRDPEQHLLLADARRLMRALGATRGDGAPVSLDAVMAVAHPRLTSWAEAITADVARTLVPSGESADWARLLGRLDAHAHAIGDFGAAARLGELAAERSRPVRLAIVGEFNAGKSTFINALVGAEVAPTGVLPTTATLHHLRWAPDPFAKIVFAPGHDRPERIVALGELRTTLPTLDPATIRRVEICMPLASLVRVEILDTPGFNAPDPEHTRVARSAFEEADVAVWLLDATQAMKETERAVLEEARRTKIPVQMLVNKADRVTPTDLARVMESVRVALEETKLVSWAPPTALSARKALAGKLGDARALQESGWGAVQALIEERIVGRSDELKERALRRRASVLVARLVEAWVVRAEADRSAHQAEAARAHEAAQAAARIERDGDGIADRLASSLSAHAQSWARDLALVFVGRDADAAARDPVLARYRVARALGTLGPALSRALASLAPEARVSPARIEPIARAIVRAAASSAPPEVDALLSAIGRAAVATFVEMLFALSVASRSPTIAEGVLRELRAFAAALESYEFASESPPPTAFVSVDRRLL